MESASRLQPSASTTALLISVLWLLQCDQVALPLRYLRHLNDKFPIRVSTTHQGCADPNSGGLGLANRTRMAPSEHSALAWPSEHTADRVWCPHLLRATRVRFDVQQLASVWIAFTADGMSTPKHLNLLRPRGVSDARAGVADTTRRTHLESLSEQKASPTAPLTGVTFLLRVFTCSLYTRMRRLGLPGRRRGRAAAAFQ